MVNHIGLVEVTCSFCKGIGKDPFGLLSELSTCGVCAGRQKVWVAAQHVACPHCRGTGAIKTFSCTVCNGTGFVSAPSGPTTVCRECNGTGDDSSNSALDCLECHGRGRLAKV